MSEAALRGSPAAAVVGGAETWRVLKVFEAARRRRRGAPSFMVTLGYVEVFAVTLFYPAAAVAALIGQQPLTSHQLDLLGRAGPAWALCGAALLAWAGLKSGARGGPLAIDTAYLEIVLLSPASRRAALLRPTLRHLAIAAGVGAWLGLAAGIALSQRLPAGLRAAFILAAGALGTAIALAFSGSAMLANGLHWGPRRGDVLGLSAVAISAAVAYLVPLAWPVEAIGLAAILVAGVVVLPSAALEGVRKRSELVGQVVFGLGTERFRSAWAAYRVLAGDVPRDRPWFRVSRALPLPPATLRDLRALLRGRPARLARLAVLAGLLAAALVVAHGFPFAVAAGGLVLYLLALDSSASLMEEADHPGLLSTSSFPRAALLRDHLWVPVAVLVAAGLVCWFAAARRDPLALLSVPVMALTAAALASWTIDRPQRMTLTAASADTTGGLVSLMVEFRYVLPVAICTAALVPLEVAGPGAWIAAGTALALGLAAFGLKVRSSR